MKDIWLFLLEMLAQSWSKQKTN